ncbi:MAG: type II toxin-antitoxin system CcdA family antitoxin [Thermoproteota archaeon]|nr:type II toxin-antitoxin system CcdA family antitoxin [Candidatus Brockarchaeota archaeon]
MEYVTISAKIEKELREKLRKYNIPISKVVRKALEEEVKRAEEEEVRKALEKIGRILEKIPDEEIVRLIREDREER